MYYPLWPQMCTYLSNSGIRTCAVSPKQPNGPPVPSQLFTSTLRPPGPLSLFPPTSHTPPHFLAKRRLNLPARQPRIVIIRLHLPRVERSIDLIRDVTTRALVLQLPKVGRFERASIAEREERRDPLEGKEAEEAGVGFGD